VNGYQKPLFAVKQEFISKKIFLELNIHHVRSELLEKLTQKTGKIKQIGCK